MNRRIDRLIAWSLILVFSILFLFLVMFILFSSARGWRWRRWSFTFILWDDNRHWDGHYWIRFLRIIACGTFWVVRSRWWRRYVSRFLFLSFILSIIKIDCFNWELGLFGWFNICWNFFICVFPFGFHLFLFILFLCCHYR